MMLGSFGIGHSKSIPYRELDVPQELEDMALSTQHTVISLFTTPQGIFNLACHMQKMEVKFLRPARWIPGISFFSGISYVVIGLALILVGSVFALIAAGSYQTLGGIRSEWLCRCYISVAWHGGCDLVAGMTSVMVPLASNIFFFLVDNNIMMKGLNIDWVPKGYKEKKHKKEEDIKMLPLVHRSSVPDLSGAVPSSELDFFRG